MLGNEGGNDACVHEENTVMLIDDGMPFFTLFFLLSSIGYPSSFLEFSKEYRIMNHICSIRWLFVLRSMR